MILRYASTERHYVVWLLFRSITFKDVIYYIARQAQVGIIQSETENNAFPGVLPVSIHAHFLFTLLKTTHSQLQITR